MNACQLSNPNTPPMPEQDDILGGETLDGDAKADPADDSRAEGATMGGDTDANSPADESTLVNANVDDDLFGDDLFDDRIKLEDLSERYILEGVLGRGGMGEVVLATDTRLNRKVAIKRILGNVVSSKGAVARFLTEAKSMAELNHTNIVQIYDYGRSTDGPFFVMECVQGGSLLDKCEEGPIELDEAINIFIQLCDGLTKSHDSGIIHRDIKPANVLMTEDGVPKLTDFGLAKDDTALAGLTATGAVFGTPAFMPPEQRQAATLTDHRSDIFSLAATFYQMLTGILPLVIDLDLVPTEIRPVVAKALKSKKEDRFQSVHEMKEAVQQAVTAGLNISRDLGEGECPHCGTTNPSDRKFCRNADCASSLEVDCLSCENGMPMWEVVCGSCGTKQDALIEEGKEALQAKHDEAEVFLSELQYDKAREAACVIGEQDDLRLQKFTLWYAEFLSRLESIRTSEHARLEEVLREALAHEQAYDYEAGLQTLNQVAPSLKQTSANGTEDTADVLTKRLTAKQSRLKELEGIVRERVTNRDIAGLLPIVNELLILKPDRPNVAKLQGRLESREESIATRNQDAVVKAKQFMTSLRFSEVISALNAIPEIERTDEIKSLIEQADAYFQQRVTASLALEKAEVSGVYNTAILHLSHYLIDIAKADIQDPQLQQRLDEAQRERSVSSRKKTVVGLGIAAACVVVMLIAGVVIKVNLDAKAVETAIANLDWETALELDPDNAEGLRLKAAGGKAAAERDAAIAEGDWETVLALDPNNSEGLRMKAAAEEAAAINAAVAMGDWETVLALDPNNSEGLRMKAAAEEAAAISSAVAMGDWETVLALDVNNSEGLRMKAAAEEAAAITVAMERAAAERAEILARDSITNSIGMTFNSIPAGTFMMGSPADETGREDNEHQHKVTISKAFYMQTTEVTQGQWKAVMGTEPWKGEDYVKEGPNYAASHVSWDDAVAYCEKLSVKESKTYRLPTEAEWEYACRAGTQTAWSFGDDENVLSDYAWYDKNAWDIDGKYAHQVELKKPNAFGLYDMHGNVFEWCHDYYEEDYYKQSPADDPQGPASGSFRVLRGGSWYNYTRFSRSAFRDRNDADFRNHVSGFRLVRELD